jgi:regulator of replication initiation timing
MIKYIVSALCGVLSTFVIAGLPMYARFIAMETTIAQLTRSVDEMTTQVQAMKIEVTELRVEQTYTNNKRIANGP